MTDKKEVKKVAPKAETKKAEAKPVAAKAETPKVKLPKTKVKVPELKEFLKAGVQFGHETKRWNPKFADYIFTQKKSIHIIDLAKTLPLLEKAGDFVAEAFTKGPVIMLGSKRQAADIVAQSAKEAGVHYITNRWAGGFLTNFKQISGSIKRLNDLERQFKEGIVGRTKYEISQMKKDWERLHRLYGGVKKLDQMPSAVIVIDPTYESGPVRECNYLDIPTVAMVDSNSDPSIIDYPIPANDDAVGSINLVLGYLVSRLKEVDTIYRIKHEDKDFAKAEVEIKRTKVEGEEEVGELKVESQTDEETAKVMATRGKTPVKQAGKEAGKDKSKDKPAKTKKSKDEPAGAGILSHFQVEKEKQVKSRK